MLSRRLLRIKVVKALYSHFKSEGESIAVSEKNLQFSIDKTYQLYHLLLELVADIRQYALRRIETGKQKMLPTDEERNPNMKFVNNRVAVQIAESKSLADYLHANKLSWSNYPDMVKKLYNGMVASDYYRGYMESPDGGYAEDRELIMDIFRGGIEDSDDLYEAAEEQSIYWADDIGFGLIMAVKTIQNMRPGDAGLRLLPEFKNDDDRVFAGELLREALLHHKEYFEMVDADTKNWDLERLAFMDRIIMLAAIAELVAFPTIPVKVTLDEYIEISKYYSTPSSGTFINGVIDKIVGRLRAEGRINKQGRGLIEN